MWGFPCGPGRVSRLVVGQGEITGGFLAPAAGLASPRCPTPSDCLCLMVTSGLEQGSSSVEGLVALQVSDSAAKSRKKACPLPDMPFTARQQPGCVSLHLPPLPFEMGSQKRDGKGKQPRELLSGVLCPMVVEELGGAVSCATVSPYSRELLRHCSLSIASDDPPAAFGNIIPRIATFCVWCEYIGSLVFSVQLISRQ